MQTPTCTRRQVEGPAHALARGPNKLVQGYAILLYNRLILNDLVRFLQEGLLQHCLHSGGSTDQVWLWHRLDRQGSNQTWLAHQLLRMLRLLLAAGKHHAT